MKNSYLIPITLLCSLLLINIDIQRVYADVALTGYAPTGSDLISTSDCWFISATSEIVFMGCNLKLYAFSSTTRAFLADIAVSTLTTNDQMIPSNSGNCVFILDDGSDINRYCYASNTITLTGNYNPPSCTPTEMSMDNNGYLWLTCSAEDVIIRFNPVTMTNYLTSPDLTDGIGVDCDSPAFAVYSGENDKGIIHCSLSNTYVSFQTGGLFTVSLLDSEPDGASEDSLVIDGKNSRFWVSRSSGLVYYAFSPTTGIITSTGTTIVATSYTDCSVKPILNLDTFVVCHGNTVVDVFDSDSDPEQVFSAVPTPFTASGVTTVRWAPNTNIWYLSTGNDGQEWYELTGVQGDVTTPPPPEQDGDQTNNPEDTDTDNDGIPNSEDNDIDGDGIQNSNDSDIDGDGIPNSEDDSPCGSNSCNVNGNCVYGTISQCVDSNGGSTGVGAFVIGNGTTGLTGIMCNIGLVDCETDSNPRTNGLGLLVFIASIFVIVASFYLTIGRDSFVIPVYIWIIIILAISGFFTTVGLIDPIFLILTVVALIALAVPQIQKRFFGGSSTFGGGSSA